jgi:hypothetical protein
MIERDAGLLVGTALCRHTVCPIPRHPDRMLAAAFALILLFLPPARAEATAPERRDPSAQEIAAFDAFYRQRFAQAPPAAPVFYIVREAGRRAWRISASVDGAPYRGQAPLCRMSRAQFSYDARAPREMRWSQPAPARQFAWIARAACGKPARLIELRQRIPDAELIPLIEQHGVLLLGSRLLLAGNTSCAPHRALRYQLAAIDVGAPPGAAEELMALVFDSDREVQAQVWVKKRGATLNAWNVSCKLTGPLPR